MLEGLAAEGGAPTVGPGAWANLERSVGAHPDPVEHSHARS